MKKILFFMLILLSMGNFAYADLPPLPTNFIGSTIVENFGVLNSDDFYSIERKNIIGTGSDFYDLYQFKITNESNFQLESIAKIRINKKISELPLDIFLFDNNSVVQAFSNTNLLEFSNLAVGIYYIGITGIAGINQNYNYSADFAISTVPLPGAAILLGSGLLGLVGLRRREII